MQLRLPTIEDSITINVAVSWDASLRPHSATSRDLRRTIPLTGPALDFQYFRCRSSQNHLALLGTQAKLLDNFDWTVIADGEAIVATHHDSLDAHLGDDELHHRRRMSDGVIHKAMQVRTGNLGGVLGCRNRIPTVIETANEVWQYTARVRQDEQEIRMAVHDSTKDEVTGRNRWCQSDRRPSGSRKTAASDYRRRLALRDAGKLGGLAFRFA